MKIGLGLVTHDRPDYYRQVIESLWTLDPQPDVFAVHEDGWTDTAPLYAADWEPPGHLTSECWLRQTMYPFGVGRAKNWCLTKLLEEGCDWLFLMEDDILVKDPGVLVSYINAAESAALHHLSFAHHGTANAGGPERTFLMAEFYRQSVGASCLYSRECLESVGLLDEGFPPNALEHVEHSLRIAVWEGIKDHPYFPDAAESQDLLEEIPGSAENTTIPDRYVRLDEAKTYWRQRKPSTYYRLWPEERGNGWI